MQRRFSKQSGGRSTGRRSSYRPAREWVPLTGTVFNNVSATSSAKLIEFQSPTVTIGTALTADPPEDRTIMRIVAEFDVAMAGPPLAADRWTLGLLMADVTWTPGATFATDADKRFLWYRTYQFPGVVPAGTTSMTWQLPGYVFLDATADVFFQCDRDDVHIDIAPKVKLESGKALTMVAYEEVSTTGNFTVAMRTMRLLMQASGRR